MSEFFVYFLSLIQMYAFKNYLNLCHFYNRSQILLLKYVNHIIQQFLNMS